MALCMVILKLRMTADCLKKKQDVSTSRSSVHFNIAILIRLLTEISNSRTSFLMTIWTSNLLISVSRLRSPTRGKSKSSVEHHPTWRQRLWKRKNTQVLQLTCGPSVFFSMLFSVELFLIREQQTKSSMRRSVDVGRECQSISLRQS